MTTKIIGTGSYVPECSITNDDLAKIMDTSDEWISSRTGIRERRISSGEGTSGMAAKAAKAALEKAGIAPEDLDIIILATSSSDFCFPNGACEVQAEIGALNAAAFDISAACSGFIFALNTMHAFFQAGIYQTGLVIGADALSKLVDWDDRKTCVLFGDGAGAAVVQADNQKAFHMVMGSDGSRGNVLACPSRSMGNFLTNSKPELGYMSMDGQEVFKFAVRTVPNCINQVLEKGNLKADDIKYFILHQANYRIFEAIAKRMKLPIEKFPMNIQKYGNTSAASIPLMLDELNREGKLLPGDKLVFSGFGGGLTWGAVLLEW